MAILILYRPTVFCSFSGEVHDANLPSKRRQWGSHLFRRAEDASIRELEAQPEPEHRVDECIPSDGRTEP